MLGISYSHSHLIGDPVRSTEKKQLNLFEVDDERQRKIVRLKRELNEKFGLFAVRSASTCNFKSLMSSFSLFSAEHVAMRYAISASRIAEKRWQEKCLNKIIKEYI